MVVSFVILGLMVFWFIIFITVSFLIQKLTDQFPSARAIGIFKEMIRKFKSQRPSEFIISHNKTMTYDSSREVVIYSNNASVHLSENEAKMLIIHLLSVYPEMDKPDDSFDEMIDKILEPKQELTQ